MCRAPGRCRSLPLRTRPTRARAAAGRGRRGSGRVEAGSLAFAQDLVDRRGLGSIDPGTEHVLAQLSWGALPRREPEAVADVRPERLREERVVLGVAPFLRKAERRDAVQLSEGALRRREQDFVHLGVLRPAT